MVRQNLPQAAAVSPSRVEFIRPKKPSVGLEMTPMIDIVFQLLIFFMLSSSFLTPALKLTLPKAVQQDKAEPERTVISIDREGHTYVNAQKVAREELKSRLESRFMNDSRKAIHLRGDAEMPYKLFVEVMDTARQAGAQQINIVHESTAMQPAASQAPPEHKMKLPYSYRRQFFNSALVASFLGHAIVLGAGGSLISLSPKYDVERAPSSMEVVITEVTPEKKQEKEPAKILTTPLPSPQEIPLKEMEKSKEEPPRVSKPIYIPPQKGALQEKVVPYLKNPAPVYPHLARERGWEGLVILSVFVETDGRPVEVKVEKSSGYKTLDDAAVKAVRKWQFKPAAIGNVSFSTRVRIPIRFTLVE